MKKFGLSALLLSSTLFAAPSVWAQTAKPRCEFLENAPDKHEVVKGDTLWGISSRFLQNPWCWPEVWGMNKEDIKNPHWIYPGQIIYFDRASGRLRLANVTAGGRNGPIPTVKWKPGIRVQGLGADAIPAIPAGVIEPFLSQPLVLEDIDLSKAPRIVAIKDDRVSLGKGQTAYVRGDLESGTSFQIFRPAKPILDPDTRKPIAYEATYLGTGKLVRNAEDGNDVHTFTIVDSKQEISIGDRLLPLPPSPILNYVPHPAAEDVRGKVVGIYGGIRFGGQNQIISINLGNEEGIDMGTVLSLAHSGRVVRDKTDGNRQVKLPDEIYGKVFIFRVFNRISYGLVLQVTDVVEVGDSVRSPQ